MILKKEKRTYLLPGHSFLAEHEKWGHLSSSTVNDQSPARPKANSGTAKGSTSAPPPRGSAPTSEHSSAPVHGLTAIKAAISQHRPTTRVWLQNEESVRLEGWHWEVLWFHPECSAAWETVISLKYLCIQSYPPCFKPSVTLPLMTLREVFVQ